MEAVIIESNLTGRIKRIRLKADSFEDERILRMIIDGLASAGTLFELSIDGVPCGSFTFSNCRQVDDGAEDSSEDPSEDTEEGHDE